MRQTSKGRAKKSSIKKQFMTKMALEQIIYNTHTHTHAYTHARTHTHTHTLDRAFAWALSTWIFASCSSLFLPFLDLYRLEHSFSFTMRTKNRTTLCILVSSRHAVSKWPIVTCVPCSCSRSCAWAGWLCVPDNDVTFCLHKPSWSICQLHILCLW